MRYSIWWPSRIIVDAQYFSFVRPIHAVSFENKRKKNTIIPALRVNSCIFSMNHHCWRDAKMKLNGDDELTWPKLSHPTTEEEEVREFKALVVSANNVNPQETLDEINFPKLGESSSKRKNISSHCNQLAVLDHRVCSKRWRRPPRSTDLICVNLQKALEGQTQPIPLLASQGTKITVDICKLNVNMSVMSPLARSFLTTSKRRIVYIGNNKKKTSRLKTLILHERTLRKEAIANMGQICHLSSNPVPRQYVSGISFNNIPIDVAPQDDSELLRKMAALSCLSTNYRNSVEIDIDEENVIFRPDLHQQMENMTIEVENSSMLSDYGSNTINICLPEFIDPDTMNATANLKICEETGEYIDDVPAKEDSDRIRFTKKFREYCTNTVSPNLTTCMEAFLAEISRLQKKMYERDNLRGRNKRRYYAGIKEVQKNIDLKKMRFVIIATDLEKVEIEGGLDDTLNKLLETCKRYDVPYCFGLGRRKLGYYAHGRGITSCIGIANYSGAEEKLKNMLLAAIEARNDFSRMMSHEGKTIDIEKLLPKEELLLSETINAYLRIIASTS